MSNDAVADWIGIGLQIRMEVSSILTSVSKGVHTILINWSCWGNPTAEILGLNPIQCEFESHSQHQFIGDLVIDNGRLAEWFKAARC